MVITITSSANYLTVYTNTLASLFGFSEVDIRTNTICQTSPSADGKYIQILMANDRIYDISTLAVWNTLTAMEQNLYYPIEELNAATYATNALLLSALKPIIFV